ncbi:hypothetical protein HDE_00851 [Halotydeus destructor]|nr:hypothetical protein HDE_00851 [Halotydeus destructor]
MRCPCPATDEQFQLFIEKYFDGYFPSVSSVVLPAWFPRNLEGDSEFLGEILLLAYPSLGDIPDTLSYPRILLEQYSASTSCQLKLLPTPDILDSFMDQYKSNDYPYARTFETMYNNLLFRLNSIDLTRGSLIPVRFTELMIEDILFGKLPKLRTAKFTMSKILDKSLLEKMKTLKNVDLLVTVCMDHRDMFLDSINYRDTWAALRSASAILEVTTSLPFRGQLKSLSSEATNLTLTMTYNLYGDPQPMELKQVRALEIEPISVVDFDSFLTHLVMMKLPGVQQLEIRCIHTLAHLPMVLMSTDIFTLNIFKACTHHSRLTERPPALNSDFQTSFRKKALIRRNEIRNDSESMEPYDEPLELCLNADCEMSEDDSDDVFDGQEDLPGRDQQVTKAALRGKSRRDKKNLLRQLLITLAGLCSRRVQTVDIRIDTIGGFTCALLRFLLATRKEQHKQLRLLPAALQGGLAVNLMPVVFGLSRNWDEVQVAFWCLPEDLGKSIALVEEILGAERKHHKTIEVTVKSETHYIHGEVVNGITAIRTIPVTREYCCSDGLCIYQPETAQLLGTEFTSARADLVVISNRARSVVLAEVSESRMSHLPSIVKACNQLCRSDAQTEDALRKLELLDVEELRVSNILYNTLNE